MNETFNERYTQSDFTFGYVIVVDINDATFSVKLHAFNPECTITHCSRKKVKDKFLYSQKSMKLYEFHQLIDIRQMETCSHTYCKVNLCFS